MERRGFLISLFLIKVLLYCGGFWKVNSSLCLDSERKSLITFRKSLNDSSNILSSWGDDASDCCKWRGITCHNVTGFVLKLDLHTFNYSYLYDHGGPIDPALSLSGRIDALVELKHLQFLDLSYNAFHGIQIPQFLGSMKELRHLNLSDSGFRGRIPHQLGNLSHLISLRLSFNSLSAKNLWWLTNLTSLKYLDMSYVNLSMASHDWVHVMNKSPSLVELRLEECGLSYISPTLASVNFTSLRVLDLSGNDFNSTIPNWIANISSLVSLNLSYNYNFQGQFPYQFSQLPNLEELQLLGASRSANCSELLEGRWSRIKLLYLSFGNMYGGIPNSIGNITSLVHLSLSPYANTTTGSIPRAITKLINLETLALAGYHTHAPIPDWLAELKNLKYLVLFNCMVTGSIPAALGGLSSLKDLYLRGNQLNGTIPAALGGLSSLQYLHLSGNQLNGTIPTTLGQLSNLSTLDLSNNSLSGDMSETHFQNLKNLIYLDLSFNSLAFDLHPDWAPPFQLSYISLRSCPLGPRFPPWLQTQKRIDTLDLSNTTISGTVPPWFWDLTSQISSLNLSHNEISGQLPNTLKMQPYASYIDLSWNHFSGPIPCILNGSYILDLSSNQFSGPIPLNFTSTMYYSDFFSARGNQISGIIPLSIGKMKDLSVLDLSQNNISGTIPLTLGDCVYLEALDLSKNRLSGRIPISLGRLHQLHTLHLSNNSLSGNGLSSLKKCTRLETLDLGHNNFSGHIPTWIGKSFPALRILSLRSNMFTGNIPPQLLNITSLQVFDVGQNCLSGSIPPSLQNLTAMKNEKKTDLFRAYGNSSFYYKENLLVSVKGLILEYTRTISLVTCMDLSMNNLSGEIPEGLTSLLGLRVLNLSGNNLTGKIPDKIGKLALLESLDFSKNHLSGSIPLSMSNLTFLSYLNLSYNNLSGRIPSGNQLRTLPDPSVYMGNKGLCGPPLTDECDSDETSQSPMPVGGDVEKDEEQEMLWFYSAMGPGFAVGFCAFSAVLVLKKSWRIAYFRFFDEMKERLF